jgi:hypothetical protein
MSGPKIVRLIDALGSHLCYTGGWYWAIDRFGAERRLTR